MSKLLDVSGQIFGRLTVTDRKASIIRPCGAKVTVWECMCSCGNITLVPSQHLRSGRTKSCGCLRIDFLKSRTGDKASNWKGGRKLHSGYVYLWSPDHPTANKGYVFEHRLVIEKQLGRFLLPQENVHHKNGVRDDNRLENLELWNTSHPSGQRAVDKVVWALEILELYEDVLRHEVLSELDKETDDLDTLLTKTTTEVYLGE